MTTKEQMKWHAQVMRRALERYKATENANPLVLLVLGLLVEEYETVHQIMPNDSNTGGSVETI